MAAETHVSVEERLWQHRNLGKALYENPTTQVQAVGEFQKALLLAPNSVREQLNYGLALLHAGRTKEGCSGTGEGPEGGPFAAAHVVQPGDCFPQGRRFRARDHGVRKDGPLVPGEPVSHYNLGVLYKQVGKLDEAGKQLETAEKLDPVMEAPHFQLYNIYRQAGRRRISGEGAGGYFRSSRRSMRARRFLKIRSGARMRRFTIRST